MLCVCVCGGGGGEGWRGGGVQGKHDLIDLSPGIMSVPLKWDY